MHSFRRSGFCLLSALILLSTGCGGGGGSGSDSSGASSNTVSTGQNQSGTGTSSSTSSSSSGGSSSSGSTSTPSASCDAPTAWTLPTTGSVVGSGTAASCTEAALRTAINAGGYVRFSCGDANVTIPVTAEISVTKTTVIDGAGKVTLDGGGNNRILVAANGQSLSVRNLRFINGKGAASMEGTGIGGAVSGSYRNHIEVIGSTFENNWAGRGGGAVGVGTGSTLVISGSVFKGNTAWYGGAVYSLLSPLTIVNSVFTNNSTVTDGGLGDGGAIGTDGASEDPNDSIGGDVSLCGVDINNNKGYGNGGGAYLWVYPPDRIIIDRTTVSNNHAAPNGRNSNGFGGAMRVSNGTIIITRSSFLSNVSDGNGGGLYVDCSPTCAITNSTFYNNSAASYGGAIFGDGPSTNNVTFANNSAGGHGGALFGKNYVLNNTVFLDNSAGNPWKQAMSCSVTGTGAHVLQWLSASSSAGSDTCISSPLAANPLLAAPANNGGATLTMLPDASSPLRGAGAGCESSDQRGQTRNTTRCTIGAVE